MMGNQQPGGPAPAAGDPLVAMLADPEASKKRLEELRAAEAASLQAADNARERVREAELAEKRAAAIVEASNENAAHNKRVEETLKAQREQIQAKARALEQREQDLAKHLAEGEAAIAEREQAAERYVTNAQASFSAREREIGERVEHVTVREGLAAAAAERAEKTRQLYEKKILELREIVNRGT